MMKPLPGSLKTYSVCAHREIHLCVHTRAHISMCVCVSICMSAYMHVCVSTRVCVHMCACRAAHAHARQRSLIRAHKTVPFNES